MNLRLYFMETRPPFLLLSPVTFSVGLALAAYEGWFSPLDAILGLLGVVLAHMGVNVLNDYFDYRSGIDLETRRTPFSGGSGMLVSGEITPKETYRLGLVCLAATALIGGYFVSTRGNAIVPVIAFAALSIYLYSSVISKLMLGEFFAGLNFGPLVSVGAYFTQTGALSWAAFIAGMVPGILTSVLLYLNEFPDLVADRSHGRRNTVIALGLEGASRFYPVLLVSTYAWVVGCVLMEVLPLGVLLYFLTLPLALVAARGVWEHHIDVGALIPFMAKNVQLVLLGPATVSLGMILSKML